MSQSPESFARFAQEILHEAGRLTLGYYNRSLDIIAKGDGSPVTVADREAEAYLRKRIEERYPEHGIYGEEYGVKEFGPGCPYTWYIDPIDGTKSFIHGVPLYTNLLALLCEGVPIVGLIQVPALGDQLVAWQGGGAWLNGRRVRVSKVERPEDAVILCTDYRDLHTRAVSELWRPHMEKARFSRSWGDAYGHFLVATGRAEAMFDPIVEPYDVAPLPVIMKEAGGEFFGWNGKGTIFERNGISANKAFAARIRADIAKSR